MNKANAIYSAEYARKGFLWPEPSVEPQLSGPSLRHPILHTQPCAIAAGSHHFLPQSTAGNLCGLLHGTAFPQSDLRSKANTYLCAQQHSQSAPGGATWTKLPKISLEVLLAQGPEDGLPSPLGYWELLHASIKLTEEIPPWDKLYRSCIQKCLTQISCIELTLK